MQKLSVRQLYFVALASWGISNRAAEACFVSRSRRSARRSRSWRSPGVQPGPHQPPGDHPIRRGATWRWRLAVPARAAGPSPEVARASRTRRWRAEARCRGHSTIGPFLPPLMKKPALSPQLQLYLKDQRSDE